MNPLCKYLLVLSFHIALAAGLMLSNTQKLAAQSIMELEQELATKEGKERLDTYVQLINSYTDDDANKTIDIANEALELLEIYPNDRTKITVLNLLAKAYIESGSFKKASLTLEQVESRVNEAQYPQEYVKMLLNSSQIEWRQKLTPTTMEKIERAEKLSIDINDSLSLGKAIYYKAIVHMMKSEYHISLEHALKSHKICQNIDDKLMIGNTINIMGLINWKLGNKQKALKHFLEAKEILSNDGRRKSVGIIAGNIGLILLEENKYDSALIYMNNALDIMTELKSNHFIGLNINNIGYAYIKKEDYKTALNYVNQSLEYNRNLGNTYLVGISLYNLATIFYKKDNLDKATKFIRQTLTTSKEIDDRDLEQKAYLLMHKIYDKSGLYRKALEAFKNHEEIKSQIFNDKNSKSIVEMQARFESEQKQKQIEILKQQEAFNQLKLKKEETIRLALTVGVLLLIALVALLFNRYRIKSAYSHEIEEKNKRLETSMDKIRELQKRYQMVFEDQNTIKLLIDLESGIILDANSASENIMQVPTSQILKQNFSSLNKKWLNKIIIRLSESQLHENNFIEAFRIANGEVKDFEALVSKIKIKQKNAALITIRDITERRKLQEETVRRQEKEKHIKELEKKNKEIETRNAEMEKFNYTVSHDLKSPLITIKGFLGLMAEDLANNDIPALKEDMEHINKATLNMNDLLNELLALSRVGRVVNDFVNIPMQKIMDKAMENIRGQLGDIQLEIDPNLPMVFCDEKRMVEVMQNLLTNAIKFSRKDQAVIKIGAQKNKDTHTFFVQDNGIGIDKLFQDKIFNIFERLDQSIEGTGIGLSVVKKIIEVHGGKVWVNSEGKDKGATFYFTIPNKKKPNLVVEV